ncbi:MAG: cbb3-type cytochrome oxidase assembly protein CcoS [Rhodobacteraceae bacterium]|nr:MAG: cbb3-type cytochrome oxidase assembly protein CcoS [Paracoccaceae bacterium]
MSLLILIPLSIGLGLIGLGAFFWALRHNQFDDPEGAAWRIIPTQNPPDTEGQTDEHLAPDTQDRNPGRGL